MQLSHDPGVVDAVFDEANLVSCAGLAPVLALAERAGLSQLLAERVTVASPNAALKVTALVAGMVAGADSINDMDLLRHGGMDRLFTGVRAPSTLGTFLRAFTFGHVRQLDAVAARLLAALAALPGGTALLPGADQVAYVDIDDTVRETHGYAKQGAGFGYSGVNGLNALLGVVSTPTASPVIAAARLRKGSTNSARGAARLVTDTLKAAAAAGADPKAGSLVIARMDSAFYGHDVIAAARRAGARFSVTARMNPAVTRAIAGIPDDAWTAIHYPNAFVDEDTGELVSDAEVAEIPVFTAFTSRRKHEQVTARLIVRRVKRLNPHAAARDPGRAGRAVHDLRPVASPRGVHRLTAGDARRRSHPPRPRRRRAGHRRPQGRAPGAPAVRGVHRKRRLARPGRDRVQPAARRRRPGLHPTRARPGRRDHRHPAGPARHRSRPDRPLRPPPHPAPTDPMALARALDPPGRSRHAPRQVRRSAISGLNPSTARPGPEQEPDVEDPDRPGDHSRLHHQARPTRLRTINETLRRWIRAELGRPGGDQPGDACWRLVHRDRGQAGQGRLDGLPGGRRQRRSRRLPRLAGAPAGSRTRAPPQDAEVEPCPARGPGHAAG